MSYRVTEQLRREAWKKFAAMDMFFVKVRPNSTKVRYRWSLLTCSKASDFLYTVPTVQHLRNVRLTMEYRELPESEALLNKFSLLQKWKNDPDADRNYGFAPGRKHFVNGELVSEERPGLSAMSATPFPEKRVPRRGLVAVSPEDPAYTTLCKEQGLGNLLGEGDSPQLPNGIHSSPAAPTANGLGSPVPLATATASSGNQPISPSPESGPILVRPSVNGVNGTVSGNAD